MAILPTNDVGKVCSVGQAPDVHPQNIHAVGDAFAVDSFSEKLEIVSPIQATKAFDIPHHLLDTRQVVTDKCYKTAVGWG